MSYSEIVENAGSLKIADIRFPAFEIDRIDRHEELDILRAAIDTIQEGTDSGWVALT